MVDENDLTLDPAFAQKGSQWIFSYIGCVGYTQFLQTYTSQYIIDGFAEYPHQVECVPKLGFVELQTDDHFRRSFQDHREQAVISAKQVLVTVIGEKELLGFCFEEIHQYNMKGMIREIADGVSAHVGRLRIVEWREVMCNINDLELGIDLQKLTLHGAGQEIPMTNV